MNASTKTAIVTGASIGFAVADAFVREGTNVVLNGHRQTRPRYGAD